MFKYNRVCLKIELITLYPVYFPRGKSMQNLSAYAVVEHHKALSL